jgi:hypothetical protein
MSADDSLPDDAETVETLKRLLLARDAELARARRALPSSRNF